MRRQLTGICIVTLAFMLSLVACGNDEEPITGAEKDRRRDLTFDLADDYFENIGEGVPSSLSIVNESGFHDVRASFNLRRSLKDGERVQVESAIVQGEPRISDSEVEQIVGALERTMGTLTLGEGANLAQRGGENVVLDAVGDTSEIALESSVVDFHTVDIGDSVEIYSLHAYLHMTAYRESGEIDYQVTRNTDNDGKNRKGTKGLLVVIDKRVEDGGGRYLSSRHITDLDIDVMRFVRVK